MDKYILYIFIVLIFLFFNLLNDNELDTIKNKLTPFMLFLIIFMVILIGIIIKIFIDRTTVYKNYIKYCDTSKSNFCYIKKIKLSVPDQFLDELKYIGRTEGTRIDIPQKSQKCISLQKLQNKIPKLIDWYKSLTPLISNVIGEHVYTTLLDQPNSLCLIVYNQEGDYIDWHFDTNHYDGRNFTLLLPVTFEKTCGNYQYKNKEGETEDVEINRDEALLFEGNKIYHRGKKLCKNEERMILSCTFTTSQKIPIKEMIFQKIKNIGIFGEL